LRASADICALVRQGRRPRSCGTTVHSTPSSGVANVAETYDSFGFLYRNLTSLTTLLVKRWGARRRLTCLVTRRRLPVGTFSPYLFAFSHAVAAADHQNATLKPVGTVAGIQRAWRSVARQRALLRQALAGSGFTAQTGVKHPILPVDGSRCRSWRRDGRTGCWTGHLRT